MTYGCLTLQASSFIRFLVISATFQAGKQSAAGITETGIDRNELALPLYPANGAVERVEHRWIIIHRCTTAAG
jgi:hypothetical protein